MPNLSKFLTVFKMSFKKQTFYKIKEQLKTHMILQLNKDLPRKKIYYRVQNLFEAYKQSSQKYKI